MPKISIMNKTDKIQVVTLDHATVCVRGGHCYCDKDRVCGSLHFGPLERKKGLDAAILHAQAFTNEKIFDVRPFVIVEKVLVKESKPEALKAPAKEKREEKREDKKRSSRKG